VRFLLPLLFVLAAGCALTNKAPPVDFRYFSPESETTRERHPQAGGESRALRLGRVTSGANLRTRIVHRDSPLEAREYETLRWTENPEVFVRRSLSRALFEDRSFQEALDGPAPVIEVEVVAFEEVRTAHGRAGRIRLRWQLHDDRWVLGRGDLTVDRDAAGAGIEHVVAALSAAMEEATGDIAAAVSVRLAAPPERTSSQ
jgi:hypothetical protein